MTFISSRFEVLTHHAIVAFCQFIVGFNCFVYIRRVALVPAGRLHNLAQKCYHPQGELGTAFEVQQKTDDNCNCAQNVTNTAMKATLRL